MGAILKFLLTILALLALANLISFAAFWVDKRRAIKREWRVSEAALLTFALFGGSLGAKLAQRLLRHKTRKRPFVWYLDAIVVAHVGVVILVALQYFGS